MDYITADRILTKQYRCRNHCTVIACALVADVNVGKAYQAMKIQAKRPRKGGCHGVEKVTEKLAGKRLIPYRAFENGTLHQWTKKLPKKGKFMIFIRGHVCAFIDGVLQDWTNPAFSHRTSGSRAKVLYILQLEEK